MGRKVKISCTVFANSVVTKLKNKTIRIWQPENEKRADLLITITRPIEKGETIDPQTAYRYVTKDGKWVKTQVKLSSEAFFILFYSMDKFIKNQTANDTLTT